MSVCGFSKEYFSRSVTSVDNGFISQYVPLASGDAVKVYLYGLSVCQSGIELTLKEFAEGVNLTEEAVKDCFRFWEEFDLVKIISDEPLFVTFLPLASGAGKPRKYNPEKYTAFSKDLQSLITGRMISTNEFTEYYNLMEVYSIKPDAMLMIIKYCIDLKGNDIGYRYISQVAKDFGAKKLVTASAIDEALSSYYDKNNDVASVLEASGITRKPEIKDSELLEKWQKMGFTLSVILYVAKTLKKKDIQKLDDFINELYSLHKFGEKEIAEYIKQKDERYKNTAVIAKTLGKYIEVIAPYADNFTAKWYNLGFSPNALETVAKYCFNENNRSFEAMDKVVCELAENGYITDEGLSQYFKSTAKETEFIQHVLDVTGTKRSVTAWDKNNYKIWKSWNFTDEMIEIASEKAVGKSSPIPYISAILGSWKNQNMFTPESVGAVKETVPSNAELLAKVLNEKRKDNYDKLYLESKNFKRCEDRLPAIELELAYAEYDRDEEKIQTLTKEKEELVSLREKTLKKHGFTSDDVLKR